MENIDTEELISMQVQHIEKEKKDLSVKTRVIAKRVDHQVRAYRKEEAPLLAEDYEQQQKVDKDTFEALQKSQKEAAENAHKSDVETKARLSRMLDDYSQRKTAIMARKGEDYAKRIDASQRKIAEEKAKRKKAVLQAREDDRKRLEEQERLQREREQEAKRLEEGEIPRYILYDACSSYNRFFRAPSGRRETPRRRGSCCCCCRGGETSC